VSRSLLSSHWYRIKHLRPRLRGSAALHRHVYRGEVWHVVEDRSSGKFHRFNPAAYRVIALLDGQRDLQQVWELVSAGAGEDIPGQDEIAQLLGQLHGADLVQADVTPDVAELFERWGKERKRKWMQRIGNPVSLKVPLVDPDRFVAALVRALPRLWGRWGALLWLAVVVPAFAMVPAHWDELTGNLQERLLAADSLLLLALVFPLVKLLHELCHAVACRMHGGEVHEMGVMLMVFYPVPYVDASSASGFAGKWPRVLVGAAGMLGEVFLAALAFYAWLALEPGFARSVAYSVFILGTVTTFFFNANPLLRYDGYYILADLIEIPGLATRATRHWRWIADHYLLGVKQAEPVPATRGERRWFTVYAPLSFGYRLFVTLSIALFVATQYLVVGVVLAIWAVVAGIGVPVGKALKGLAMDAQYADRGPRIRAVFGGGAVLLGAGLFALPLPHHTAVDGVLWLPDHAIVRAEAGGFVSRVAAAHGQVVPAGAAIVESHDPALAARREAQAARVEEAAGRLDAAWGDPAQAQQIDEELRREQAALARLDDEVARLTARAAVAGRVVLPRESSLAGTWVPRGEVLAYLRTDDAPRVRLVVTQAQVDEVRADTRAVQVRLPQDTGRIWPASLGRVVPAASERLPSAALGQRGGGALAIDPADKDGTRALDTVFEVELELPREVPHEHLGSRVHVRFAHAPEPVGWRWARAVRRSFLTMFHW
jgi:putative peptide zinc metalloprotease protein